GWPPSRSRRSPNRLTERMDAWSLDHPWLWAAMIALPVFIILILTSVTGIAALGAAAGCFAVAGWSMSRGPVRRATERRLQHKHDSN
ncbi:MAG TPA: hypothetical protein VIK54_14980, partial [Acidimicrobiia bacterium]